MIDRSALANATNDVAFGEMAWLTFYLDGAREQLQVMVSTLIDLGAVNLEGAEYGFVYAKIPVALSLIEIEQLIAQVRDLAAKSGVGIGVIDLDSSSDVERSTFYTLWQAASGSS